jgi:hypothetical protein
MDIKPSAMAMPRDTSTLKQGKYGPIFPKTRVLRPAILAKIAGTEANFTSTQAI